MATVYSLQQVLSKIDSTHHVQYSINTEHDVWLKTSDNSHPQRSEISLGKIDYSHLENYMRSTIK